MRWQQDRNRSMECSGLLPVRKAQDIQKGKHGMVSYRKIGIQDDKVLYEYYPEGDETTPGMVWVSRDGAQWGLISMPEGSFSAYYVHAVMDIRAAAKQGFIRESGETEWYEEES